MKSTVNSEETQVGVSTKNEKTLKRADKEGTAAPRTPEQEELVRKAEEILENLKTHTWRELETHGRFAVKMNSESSHKANDI